MDLVHLRLPLRERDPAWCWKDWISQTAGWAQPQNSGTHWGNEGNEPREHRLLEAQPASLYPGRLHSPHSVPAATVLAIKGMSSYVWNSIDFTEPRVLREQWNAPWGLSVPETRQYLLQRALFPYPGTRHSPSCLRGGPCRPPSWRVCQGPGLPVWCTREGPQMSLILENSLRTLPAPRKGNNTGRPWVRLAAKQQHGQGEAQQVRARGRGYHPAPYALVLGAGPRERRRAQEQKPRRRNARRGRTNSSSPGTQLSPPNLQCSPSLGQ